MKRYLPNKTCLFLLAVLYFRAEAQHVVPSQPGRNYVVTRTYISDHPYQPETKVRVDYFDELGRPIQSIDREQSPGNHDIVMSWEYDGLGREVKSYLPYTKPGTNAVLQSSWKTEQASFYQAGCLKCPQTDYPYAYTDFENSPNSTVKKQGSPGEAWQPQTGERAVAYSQRQSHYSDQVYVWQLSPSGLPEINGMYGSLSLFVKETEDEDGQKSEEYIDLEGKPVMSRVISGPTGEYADSYYVYDDFGRVAYIIPPQFASLVYNPYTCSQQEADQWCYQYRYDDHGRKHRSRSPGADWVEAIFDKTGRVALTQNGNQRVKNEYTFYKYDELNRQIMMGLLYDARPLSEVRSDIENQNHRSELREQTMLGYTNEKCFPYNIPEDSIYIIHYYDDYEYDALSSIQFVNDFPASAYFQMSERVKNARTGKRVKALGENTWLTTAYYYDDRGNAIQTQAENYLDGFDRFSDNLDFSGKLLESKSVFQGTYPEVTIRHSFDYTLSGVLRLVIQKVNQGPEITTDFFHYNELGQLVMHQIHLDLLTDGYTQSVDYRYNTRGWLTSINNKDLANDGGVTNEDDYDIFGMELKYHNDHHLPNPVARYNGTISEIDWMGRKDKKHRAYRLGYDGYNQLSTSAFESLANPSENDRYNEALTYDLNGNITTLTREGKTGQGQWGTMDDLAYDYQGNTLLKVDDGGQPGTTDLEQYHDQHQTGNPDFEYDANGNLIADHDKGIELEYDLLDNLAEIKVNQQFSIAFSYLADGTKLRRMYLVNGAPVKTETFINGMTYENGVRHYLQKDNGKIYFEPAGSVMYEYSLTDHLGNVRATFKPGGDSYVLTNEPNNDEEGAFPRFMDVAAYRDNTIAHNSRFSSKLINTTGPYIEIPALEGDVYHASVWHYHGMIAELPPIEGNRPVQGGSNPAFLIPPVFYNNAVPASGRHSEASLAGPRLRFNLLALPQLARALFPKKPVAKAGGGEWMAFAAPPSMQAYLKLELFDADGNFVRQQVKYVGSPDTWHQVSLTENIDIVSGTLKVSLVNFEPNPVWFDDLLILKECRYELITEDHYYPYGMRLGDLSHYLPAYRDNFHLYQGKRYEDTAGLFLHDFHARYYSPGLGRFLGVDPQGQFHSPFLAMSNNPVNSIDPDGEIAIAVIIIGAAIIAGTANAIANRDKISNIQEGIKYFSVGALAGAAAATVGVVAAPAILAAMGSGFIGGAAVGTLSGATSGFIMGSGNTWMGGGSFANGFVNGIVGAGTGAAFGAATGGIISGTNAALHGRNFFTGASKPLPSELVLPEKSGGRIVSSKSSNSNDAIKIDASNANSQLNTGTNDPLGANGMRISQGDLSGKSITNYYPADNGFATGSKEVMLKSGQVVDRYGSDFGNYLAPKGTPAAMRSLPYGTTNQLSSYQVIKPFPVRMGVTAPYYGQPGGGTQYLTPVQIRSLIELGYLKPIF